MLYHKIPLNQEGRWWLAASDIGTFHRLKNRSNLAILMLYSIVGQATESVPLGGTPGPELLLSLCTAEISVSKILFSFLAVFILPLFVGRCCSLFPLKRGVRLIKEGC